MQLMLHLYNFQKIRNVYILEDTIIYLYDYFRMIFSKIYSEFFFFLIYLIYLFFKPHIPIIPSIGNFVLVRYVTSSHTIINPSRIMRCKFKRLHFETENFPIYTITGERARLKPY